MLVYDHPRCIDDEGHRQSVDAEELGNAAVAIESNRKTDRDLLEELPCFRFAIENGDTDECNIGSLTAGLIESRHFGFARTTP